MSKKFIGSLDQGTTSTRFILFNAAGEICHSAQLEHKQIYPKPGWVEHDPKQIWDNSKLVIEKVLLDSKIEPSQIASIGITNQRETVVAWNKRTGGIYYNAIVWQDQRGVSYLNNLIADGGIDRLRIKTGLPLAPYFSASKMQWLLENIPDLRKEGETGDAVFGTIDSWLLWNLTGGVDGGVHATDVTNASRTLLMCLEKLEWDQEILELFGIPLKMLPQIKASVPDLPYGYALVIEPKIPISGILGDQQAALFGQACFRKGMSKSTYGTGGFLLMNTGEQIVHSRYGLLTTVAYQVEGSPAKYALEGSIAIAGASIQWVRDNLGMIKTSREIDSQAESVEDSGGVYFVPAFSGLFAPYWEPNARGVICGMTSYVTKAHLCRAVLEATAFQTMDLFTAMKKDSQIELPSLKVDGGMVKSEVLMQFQADMLNVPVIRPMVTETTALGAAYAAGLAVGFWKNEAELSSQWKEEKRWIPEMSQGLRYQKKHFWKKAVQKASDWIESE
ncbi:MAG: glycerol kinase GlpK [Spirochaetales bacterium]|nr:glycerol kinase GlpK [Spirochaetales bacterium]